MGLGGSGRRIPMPGFHHLRSIGLLSITREADYALIAMADLAERYRTVTRIRVLSERRRIPAPVLRKILSTPAGRNLVTSVQSPTGGFRLARPPGEISIGEVIAAIEGSFRFTSGTGTSNNQSNRECERKRACPVVGPMRTVHALIEQCLAGVSIDEFACDTIPEALTLERRTRGRCRDRR